MFVLIQVSTLYWIPEFFLKFYLFYVFLAVLGLCFCTGLSLVVESRSHSLAAVRRLVIAVGSRCGAWTLGHLGQ